MLCLRTKKPSDPNSFNETGCRGGTDNLCITKLFLRSCAFGFLTKNTLGPPLSWRWCLLPHPSQCSGGFNVFVRCFRKVAPSFTWHGLETWRPKPPAGKMVLINHQPTISPGGWDCLCPPPPSPTILDHHLLAGGFPLVLSDIPRIPHCFPPSA